MRNQYNRTFGYSKPGNGLYLNSQFSKEGDRIHESFIID
jgi:hypothetical protein